MASFFEKSGWTALKRQHGLDDPQMRTCVVPMDKALKQFHDLEEDEINVKSIDAVADAVKSLQTCLKKQKASSAVDNMTSEMSADAKKYSDQLQSIIKTNLKGYFKKAGWANTKKELELDQPDLEACRTPIEKTLKRFFEIDPQEITVKSIESVYEAVETFEKCAKKKEADPSVIRGIMEMRGAAKKFHESLSSAIKKGLA